MKKSDTADHEAGEDDSQSLAIAVAALLGETFDIPFLLSLGFPTDVLDEPFDTGILSPLNHFTASFRTKAEHERYLETLPWSARRKWSEKIAELIERQESPSARAAHFFAQAQRYEDACRHWLAAGQEACKRADYSSAQPALTAALENFPPNGDAATRLTIIDSLIHCFQAAGDTKRLLEIGKEFLRNSGEDPERSAHAQRVLASAHTITGDGIQAIGHWQKAAEIGERSSDRATRVRGWAEYGLNLLHLFRVAEGESALKQALSHTCQDTGVRWSVIIRSDLALAKAMKGQHDEATQLANEAMEAALDSGNHELVARAYRRKANIACYAGDYQSERNNHIESISLCRLQKEVEGEQSCMACLSYSFVQTGEWTRALETSRQVRRSNANPLFKAIASLADILVYGFRGEVRRSRKLALDTLRRYREMDAVNFDFYPLWILGFLSEVREEPEKASEYYREIRLLWNQRFDYHDAVPGLLFGATHSSDQQDAKALSETLECLIRITEQNGCDENEAALAAARAEQRVLDGDLSKAQEHFQSAIRFSDRVGSPIFAVHLRWRYWRMLHISGDIVAAEALYREALSIMKKLGMRPYLDRFRINPGGKQFSSIQETADPSRENKILTPRQIEVLRAIGQGMTNKETADSLGLSTRTIEMHVAGAMERLNCRSRAEAVRKASDEG
ncbi:MAG: LuxR C-terminal-related transcriptional regulator, partial [Puniceicoccales bacterium]